MFKQAVEKILEREGGFVNHKSDRGGATNFGITINTLSRWRGKTASVSDVKNMKKDEAIAIYKSHYWSSMKLDHFRNGTLAALAFDQGVNRGVYAVAKDLQKLAGVKADGKIGPVSLKAINKADGVVLGLEFIKRTQIKYAKIVRRNPSQAVFIVGWINRSHELLDTWFKGEG